MADASQTLADDPNRAAEARDRLRDLKGRAQDLAGEAKDLPESASARAQLQEANGELAEAARQVRRCGSGSRDEALDQGRGQIEEANDHIGEAADRLADKLPPDARKDLDDLRERSSSPTPSTRLSSRVMFRQGPVPILVHGLLDYLVGALLIAGPFLFGFTDDIATATAVGVGVLLLVIAGASDLPTGFVRSIPRALHAVLDYVLAIALLASPFLLGFTGDKTATPFVIAVGVLQLMQTIATRFLRPKCQHARRAAG